MAAQNTFWVSPEEKINRLIKQLAEAQAESAVRAVEIEALQRQLADCRAVLKTHGHASNCERLLCQARQGAGDAGGGVMSYKHG